MLRQTLLAVLFATLPHVPTTNSSRAAPPADITGHWEAPFTGDAKTFTFSFDFVAKGETLTGTVELSTIDRTFPITSGTIKDKKVSFSAFGDWKGELVGEELRLTREIDYGRTQKMVAHRAPKN
jgi:hypothetical protein